MWWLLLLTAGEVGARDARIATPTLAPDEAITSGTPRLIPATFDLAAHDDAADYRLPSTDAGLSARPRNPLAIAAIDDDRERLVIGVKPGPGKNKLGVAYRLRLGR